MNTMIFVPVGVWNAFMPAVPHLAATSGVHAEKVIPFIDVQTATGYNVNAVQHTERCSTSF